MPKVKPDQCKAQLIHENYTQCCQKKDGHKGDHRFKPRRTIAVFFSYEELDKLIGAVEVQEEGAAGETLADLYADLKLKLIDARNEI